MQTFKQITDRLKTILNITRDKDLAAKLGIKPTTFASMKRRNKIPYAAILDYCNTNAIDANDLLLDKPAREDGDIGLLSYESESSDEKKITIKCFESLEDYARYLEQ